MNVTLTGATGFVGKRLAERLVADGHHVHAAGRHAPRNLAAGMAFTAWPSATSPFPSEALAEADTVIHLAGEPVSQRWNAQVKERIRSSRVDGTRSLVEAISRLPRRPSVLVCSSATGFYGDRGDEILTEQSPPGDGFLAGLCAEWEHAAASALGLGLRVVSLRTGIVLGPGGGALAKMLPPFRAGLGGKLGAGEQWMSWIHLSDIVEMLYFVARNESLSGPVNGVSPEPVRNEDFTRALAAILHRPAFFSVPKLALAALYGEMADVLLSSARAVPKAAEAAGFVFEHRALHGALEASVS